MFRGMYKDKFRGMCLDMFRGMYTGFKIGYKQKTNKQKTDSGVYRVAPATKKLKVLLLTYYKDVKRERQVFMKMVSTCGLAVVNFCTNQCFLTAVSSSKTSDNQPMNLRLKLLPQDKSGK